MSAYTAHVDTFARDHLPPAADWPVLDLSTLPALAAYPDRLNCAVALLDQAVAAGHGERPVFHFDGTVITYRALLDQVNRIARVLLEDLGLVPGNRVLLRGFNHPMTAAGWLAVVKAGGIAVATMPQLRARELAYIVDKARIGLALCDARLADALVAVQGRAGAGSLRVVLFGSAAPDALEARMAGKSDAFAGVDTAADDVAFIAFTSGTTGPPKGAMHFHREVLAVCDTFSKHLLDPTPDDVFCGTPPLAFAFGLGALLLFPLRAGAAAVLLERATPDGLLRAIQDTRATICSTAPTMYRAMVELVGGYDLSSLRHCVSAGETLPLATYQRWLGATGLRAIDGIGTTELLHIVIAAAGDAIRPGATGTVVPGYRARVTDDDGRDVPPGTIGLLAVQGPTGCKYLDDAERQRTYVRDGWNVTGDAYTRDADGYFWYQARADDLIISAGYNIAGPEVEAVLLEHPQVQECAVVAAPDPERGCIVKAFVVLTDPADAGPALVSELQDFVKREIAPYKYPRAIEFTEELPRTETGKVQRYRLRQLELERANLSPLPPSPTRGGG